MKMEKKDFAKVDGNVMIKVLKLNVWKESMPLFSHNDFGKMSGNEQNAVNETFLSLVNRVGVENGQALLEQVQAEVAMQSGAAGADQSPPESQSQPQGNDAAEVPAANSAVDALTSAPEAAPSAGQGDAEAVGQASQSVVEAAPEGQNVPADAGDSSGATEEVKDATSISGN